jgi:hypothetical protein
MNVATAPDTITYVLDSNIFIEAKQRYYAFDVCPGFWEALVWQHGQGRIVSVDRVKTELEGFGDDLSAWVTTTMPEACFFDTDLEAVTGAYAEAIGGVMGQAQFTDAAKAEFTDADNADAWVIAFAKAMDATVVTHEKPNAAMRRKVPIPNVCDALRVPYLDTFEMLRGLATRFSWQAP